MAGKEACNHSVPTDAWYIAGCVEMYVPCNDFVPNGATGILVLVLAINTFNFQAVITLMEPRKGEHK